jgi:hypothetical protein
LRGVAVKRKIINRVKKNVVGAVKRTRGYYDDEGRHTRSFLVKVCDYGVAVLFVAGVLYSTYLDIGNRFKPSNAELVAAKHAKIAAETAMK